MRKIWENSLLGRILLPLILVTVLNLTPRSHAVTQKFEQARRAIQFESPEAVSVILVEISERLPWRTDLWLISGYQALLGGDPQSAVANFERAASIRPLSQDAHIALGDALRLSGDLPGAIETWEDSLQAYGPNEDVLIRLIAAHWYERDYPATIADLKLLMSHSGPRAPIPEGLLSLFEVPNEPTPNLPLGLGLLLAAHQPESAPVSLLQAAEIDGEVEPLTRFLVREIRRALPEDNPAYTLMASGQALADLGYWELAAHAFRRVTEFRPEYPDAWAYLGEARQHLDSGLQGSARDELIPELQKALQLDPSSLAANIFAALYWGRNGHPERALEMLEVAADVDPDNPALLADLGRTLATLGDLQGSQSYYQEAIELTPSDPTYLRALANFSIKYNYHVREIAVPAAREALMLDRDNPASLDLMGQVMLVLGDYRSAERFLSQAVGNDPNYALAHIHLGTLYLLQEDTKRAREHITLARSLAVDPSIAEHAKRMWEDFFQPSSP